MIEILLVIQGVLLIVGCIFFAIGTLGLFRFSSTLMRIHALTKVDNLGLGFVVLALLPGASSVAVGVKMILIWMVALAASATAAHLIARAVEQQETANGAAGKPDD